MKLIDLLDSLSPCRWLRGARLDPTPMERERDKAASRTVRLARGVRERVKTKQIRLIIEDAEDLGDMIRPDDGQPQS